MLASLSDPAIAGPTCKELLGDFIKKMKQADSKALRALIPQVDLSCPEKNQLAARRNLGKLHALEAEARLEAGQAVADIRSDLGRFQKFGDHWQLQRIRGQLASRGKAHQVAAEHFMRALDLIEDPNFTPKAPAPEIINAIHEAATEQLSLTSKIIAMSTRSGDTRAYYSRSLRGAKIPKKNPQITFVYNEIALDAKGERAARNLVPILRKESAAQVTVIGHTDDRGSDEYNSKLSQGRAMAIKSFLETNGFSGTIDVRWCGKRVPAAINNAARYDREEIWRISRRVEVFYDPKAIKEERYAPCIR